MFVGWIFVLETVPMSTPCFALTGCTPVPRMLDYQCSFSDVSLTAINADFLCEIHIVKLDPQYTKMK